MPDMLVRLYELPDINPCIDKLKSEGIIIRRAQAYELRVLCAFVEKHFSTVWSDEVKAGFAHQPITVFIAVQDKTILGFGAYECTRKGFFGPTGVSEAYRGRGLGAALLLACLKGMLDMGYAYAIIGGAGPTDFYEKIVGAEVIERSIPGIYDPPVEHLG